MILWNGMIQILLSICWEKADHRHQFSMDTALGHLQVAACIGLVLKLRYPKGCSAPCVAVWLKGIYECPRLKKNSSLFYCTKLYLSGNLLVQSKEFIDHEFVPKTRHNWVWKSLAGVSQKEENKFLWSDKNYIHNPPVHLWSEIPNIRAK